MSHTPRNHERKTLAAPRRRCRAAGTWYLVVLAAVALFSHQAGRAADAISATIVLAVQPIYGMDKTKQAFRPLAEYLSAATGRDIEIASLPNFLAYWHAVRKPNSYALILDSAHFTDYRVQKLGYSILAKVPGYINYSLAVRKDSGLVDPRALVGKRVATLGLPSMGAIRLAALYPNPLRQPNIIEVQSAEAALRMLKRGRAKAAMLPLHTEGEAYTHDPDIAFIAFTEPAPHYALSAAPGLDGDLREAVRRALLTADQSERGRAMLRQIGLPGFVSASAGSYAGQGRMLARVWGY